MLLTGYKASVISIKRYSVGEHRVSLVSSELNVEDCETLWFHIVPLFFIVLLTVPSLKNIYHATVKKITNYIGRLRVRSVGSLIYWKGTISLKKNDTGKLKKVIRG